MLIKDILKWWPKIPLPSLIFYVKIWVMNVYLFFETAHAVNFGVTGVPGDFPWRNFSFFHESHSSSSFQNLLPHLCPIYISKMYSKRKNVHVWCVQLMTVSHLNTSVVHGVSQYLRHLSCHVSAFSGRQKMIPDLLGVWVITWM